MLLSSANSRDSEQLFPGEESPIRFSQLLLVQCRKLCPGEKLISYSLAKTVLSASLARRHSFGFCPYFSGQLLRLAKKKNTVGSESLKSKCRQFRIEPEEILVQ